MNSIKNRKGEINLTVSSGSTQRRSLRPFTLITLFAGAFLSACSASPIDSEESTQGPTGAVQASTPDAPSATPTAGEQPSVKMCPSAEEIVAALDCVECTVVQVGRVNLPMTGTGACTAKVLDPSGEGFLFTLTDEGAVANEADLLREERALYREAYGAMNPELVNIMSQADGDDVLSVWMWTRMALTYPAKEDLIQNPKLAQAFAEEAWAKAAEARQPVKVKLAELGAELAYEDGMTPLLRADLPAKMVRELSQMPEIVTMGVDLGEGRPLSTAWHATSRANTAAALATGAGQNVCVVEGGRPDDTSQLELAGTAVPAPGGGPDAHIRWTSGIIRNTGATEMASNASIYIGNWGGYTYSASAPTVYHWCWNQGARTVNFSWTFDDGSAGGIGGADLTFDFMTKLYPYPLIVPAAGNFGCTAKDTVTNRGYNTLVVGGLNDQGDTTLTNDTIYNCSSWRNPTSTHSDRELPYVVAPAVGVAAAGLDWSGTSGAAPQVTGAVALMASRNAGQFNAWPEMKRAAILATSVRNIDSTPIYNLYTGMPDTKDGVGALNAFFAADLANLANYRTAGSAAATAGYYATTLHFTADFTGSISNYKWNMLAGNTGRLRAALTFDSSAVCNQSDYSNCTTDTLDADLDLLVIDTVTGATVCTSGSYDNSFEVCDFAPVPGRQYRAEIQKWSTTAASTYVGIAWYAYDPANQ
ncbi:MAG: S8 family serine peptidase [Polyangiaceae bacterium]|nr:S8 family serine peptidase [Polyangiaceae bacterium]